MPTWCEIHATKHADVVDDCDRSTEAIAPTAAKEGDMISDYLVASRFVITNYNLEFGSALNLELRRHVLALNQGRP